VKKKRMTAEFERIFLSAPLFALPIMRERTWNLPARAGRAIAFRVETAKRSQAQGARTRLHFNEFERSRTRVVAKIRIIRTFATPSRNGRIGFPVLFM
jgi:hypothetical protein